MTFVEWVHHSLKTEQSLATVSEIMNVFKERKNDQVSYTFFNGFIHR